MNPVEGETVAGSSTDDIERGDFVTENCPNNTGDVTKYTWGKNPSKYTLSKGRKAIAREILKDPTATQDEWAERAGYSNGVYYQLREDLKESDEYNDLFVWPNSFLEQYAGTRAGLIEIAVNDYDTTEDALEDVGLNRQVINRLRAETNLLEWAMDFDIDAREDLLESGEDETGGEENDETTTFKTENNTGSYEGPALDGTEQHINERPELERRAQKVKDSDEDIETITTDELREEFGLEPEEAAEQIADDLDPDIDADDDSLFFDDGPEEDDPIGEALEDAGVDYDPAEEAKELVESMDDEDDTDSGEFVTWAEHVEQREKELRTRIDTLYTAAKKEHELNPTEATAAKLSVLETLREE